MGYKGNEYDNVWLGHQEDFESLLVNLNQTNKFSEESSTAQPSCSDAKQTETKERHKVEKKKKSENEKEKSLEECDEENRCTIRSEELRPSSAQVEQVNGVLFKTNVLSISDYFAQKMKSKQPKVELDDIGNSEKQEPDRFNELERASQKTTECKPNENTNGVDVKDEETRQQTGPLDSTNSINLTHKLLEAFKGSNLAQLYGYTPYNITTNLNTIMRVKCKKAARKRSLYEKKIANDADEYCKKKKPKI
jgi:hypothetical protein